MENSRIDAAGLLLAVAAVLIAFTATQLSFGYMTSLAGITLLLVLFAYDRQGYRSGLQSLAFAAVCGICLMLACGYLLRLGLDVKTTGQTLETWLSAIWLGGTVIFCSIDRARMSSRAQAGFTAPSPAARPTGQGFISQATVQPITYAPPTPAAPQPIYQPVPQPAPQHAVQQPEPVVYVPEQPAVYVPEPAAPAYVAPPQPVTPAPPPPPVPSGKETLIYVNLLGEAMNMLRAVRAEHVGRDFYLIADEMPANENWEFKPGQIVRCKKKNLSSGKGLVAFEEAPRA